MKAGNAKRIRWQSMSGPGYSVYISGTVKALPYVGFKEPYDLNHKTHKKHRGKKKLFSVLFVVTIQISQPVSILMFEAVAKGQITALSFRTGIVRNPSGRDSHPAGHSPPCEVDPLQSIYRMTAESVVVS